MRDPTVKLKESKLGKHVPKALMMDELELLRDSCTSILKQALMEFFFTIRMLGGEGPKAESQCHRRAARLCERHREGQQGAGGVLWLKGPH
ncbi:hypothetical protein JZ785_02540 [Alicyclobacillus curvatus]|nr:hypothetical protein JZ785_02540 [Alicyclobacillus curvatus]